MSEIVKRYIELFNSHSLAEIVELLDPSCSVFIEPMNLTAAPTKDDMVPFYVSDFEMGRTVKQLGDLEESDAGEATDVKVKIQSSDGKTLTVTYKIHKQTKLMIQHIVHSLEDSTEDSGPAAQN